MSQNHDPQAALKAAREREGKYEWLEAAKSYERALSSEGQTSFAAAETWERISVCYSRASGQAETQEEFKKLSQLAVEAYVSAAKLFEKDGSLKGLGKSAQCQATAAYLLSWLATSPSDKRERLAESIGFETKGLEAFEKAGDELDYGKTCNDLLGFLLESIYVAPDWKGMRDASQKGMRYADKAITVLSKLGDKSEILRAYFATSLLGWYAANISEEEGERKELMRKSLSCSEKAVELSREVGNPYYAAMAQWAAAICIVLFTEKVESSFEHAEEMLRQGMIVKDNYLKGVAYYVLTLVTNWMTLREADPDKQKKGREKILAYAEDAIRCLQLVSQDYFIAETYLFYAESCSSLGRDVEATSEKKREMLEKAVEVGRKGLEHANRSGSPDATGSTLHALSKALHFYSNFAVGKEEKTRLLEEALVRRQELNRIGETAFPANDWIRGVGKSYEAQIKAELVKLEADKDKKKTLLESAVSDMEDGVMHCRKWISSNPVPTRIAAVGAFEDSFGGILNELYLLTDDEKILGKAVEIYDRAAKDFKKVNLPSRVAESYWKMAITQDNLRQHHKAAENFDSAFAEYKNAAQRITHFADFYLDYATYMRAWSEIERACSAHEHEQYDDAMKHYERAGSLLKQTKSWGYVSLNFIAWSVLEQAEDLSRKESSVESIEAFKKAAELFEEAKGAFEEQTDKIQNRDEKEMAIRLSRASLRRRDYCLARVDVEEARICDRKGDYAESAQNYGSAATIFERILETVESEDDRREIHSVAYMCRAWQKMKLADGRASPELYHEASELFLKAKEHSAKDKTALLASGNCAFGQALEYGTGFEASREKEDFLKAKHCLESAANYYLKAGFDSASAWTSATEILFDAYNYMINAETEAEPEKKMTAYSVAEKCLERSAGLYETAGYVGKRDEVLRILEKVREKREFALSLGEVMSVPSDAKSTKVMTAPGMTVEEPVGLLKFEREFVQANLIVHRREVIVGEILGLDIQLANLGKSIAFLIKVEEVIPEGFDLIEKPEKCIVTDGGLNLKGRRLAPLETEEMKLALKPKKKGKFVFTPKIQFMDEAGEYKSCVLEQVTVTVKELGIRGWLKGQG